MSSSPVTILLTFIIKGPILWSGFVKIIEIIKGNPNIHEIKLPWNKLFSINLNVFVYKDLKINKIPLMKKEEELSKDSKTLK